MQRDFPDDDRAAWLRWPREPSLWFGRFTKYRRMGITRSRIKVYREWVAQQRDNVDYSGTKQDTEKPIEDIESCPSSWDKKAKEWRWEERADLWDRHQYEQEEKEYEERRTQIQHKSWTLCESLLLRIQEMIQYPITEIQSEDDEGKQIIIKPVKWTSRDIQSHVNALRTLGDMAVYGVYNPRGDKRTGFDGSIPVITQGDAELVSNKPKMLTPSEREGLSNKELINRVLEQVADAS